MLIPRLRSPARRGIAFVAGFLLTTLCYGQTPTPGDEQVVDAQAMTHVMDSPICQPAGSDLSSDR